jgi:succinate dehydrogenase/fumarate reductase flavoprotein subunit
MREQPEAKAQPKAQEQQEAKAQSKSQERPKAPEKTVRKVGAMPATNMARPAEAVTAANMGRRAETTLGASAIHRAEAGSLRVRGVDVRAYAFNTVVVGTGAAGYNAACRLHGLGQRDVAIVTEGVGVGTSRNAGSDKQTYYKLTLAGGEGDSVREMAETLFAGGCVDGDIALCEAALSAQSFFRLVELGVPFPRNRYGEHVGYKTDHDPRRRATSAGPYTSRLMTERLQGDAEARGIPVFDGMQAVRAVVEGGACRGVLCYAPACRGYALFYCRNLIFATGGPAGMYADSAYPAGQCGATGIALEAGAAGRNLTEWQYGLASVAPRWNVSGTFMQALPRFVSTDRDGGGEREFLYDYFRAEGDLLDSVFLKGYQWPFDARKAAGGGSSAIDMLVFMERGRGRRVFLDYRRNPRGGGLDFSLLGGEARAYLEKAGACFGSPFDRLMRMNSPAVDFYRDRGVDLAAEPLEIALCAQHNNGGLAVDCHWQTSVEGIFAAGEAAATHGVYRPGGSALNAGQAGSFRAAAHIAARRAGSARADGLSAEGRGQIEAILDLAEAALRGEDGGANGDSGAQCGAKQGDGGANGDSGRCGAQGDGDGGDRQSGAIDGQGACNGGRGAGSGRHGAGGAQQGDGGANGDSGNSGAQGDGGAARGGEQGAESGRRCGAQALWDRAARRMSRVGGPMRDAGRIEEAIAETKAELVSLAQTVRAPSDGLGAVFRLRDVLICQLVYLSAMADYAKAGGKSRGSALYADPRGSRPYEWLPDGFAFALDDGSLGNMVQEAAYANGEPVFSWREARPIPEADDFFENVWREFREGFDERDGA